MSRGVLITGASRGIGRATALAFAEEGDRVAVHYNTGRREAEQTLAWLPDDEDHMIVQADLSDPAQAARMVEEVTERFGIVDVLVNNAGVAPTEADLHPIATVSYEDWQAAWRRMIDVNLFGAANVTWAFARRLVERGLGGAVVNVGSRGAYRGEPDHPAYGASKAALHAFGQSVAVSLAPYGISVATVAPGFIATERQEWAILGKSGEAVRAQSPYNQVGQPDDVAAAILYLASADAKWSTGAVLDVNGASYLR